MVTASVGASLSSGQLENDGVIDLNGRFTGFGLTGGTVTGDGTINIGSENFGQDNSLQGTGTLSNHVVNKGVIWAGTVSTPGILNVTGDYTQTARGSYAVLIGGLTPVRSIAESNVTGSAVLDGSLDAGLIDGFSPSPGTTFSIFTGGSRSGTFSNLPDNATLSISGQPFRINYTLTGITLTQTGTATAATTTTVSSSTNPSAPGQAVTFTATVSAGAGSPTGTVTFTLDGAAQTPVMLSGGRATFTTSTLAVGTHTVQAVYPGDSTFSGSSGSLASNQTVREVGGEDPGRIRGVVFLDYNASGIQDANEPGLPGRTIFLDTNDNGGLDPGKARPTTGVPVAGLLQASRPATIRCARVRARPRRRADLPTAATRDLGGGRPDGPQLRQRAHQPGQPGRGRGHHLPASPDAATAFVRGIYHNLLHRDAEPRGSRTGRRCFGPATTGPGAAGWRPASGSPSSTAACRWTTTTPPSCTGRPRPPARAARPPLPGRGRRDRRGAGFPAVAGIPQRPPGHDFLGAGGVPGRTVAEAEAAGLASWTNELQTQRQSLREVALGIVHSDESYLRVIDSYYAVFLHRLGEELGRQSWFDQLRASRGAAGPIRRVNPLSSVGTVGHGFLAGNEDVAEYFGRAHCGLALMRVPEGRVRGVRVRSRPHPAGPQRFETLTGGRGHDTRSGAC